MINHTAIRKILLGIVCFISSASAIAENDLPNTCRLLDANTAKSILHLEVEPLDGFKDLPEGAFELRHGTSGINAEPGVISSSCARYAAPKLPSRNPAVVLRIEKHLDKKARKAALKKMESEPKEKDMERLQIDGIVVYIYFTVERNGDMTRHMAHYLAFKENITVSMSKIDLTEKWAAKTGRGEVLEFIKRVFGAI
jgi:hypothetical protein